MAKVDGRKTARKALESFVKYSVVVAGALSTVEIPEGELTDAVLLSVGVGAISAVVRAINNVRKTRQAPTPRTVRGWAVLLGLLTVGLSGCATVTGPDGMRTTTLDGAALVETLDTAFATWERYEARRKLLEEEKARAEAERDAERVAIIEQELARLAPKLESALRRVEDLAEKSK